MRYDYDECKMISFICLMVIYSKNQGKQQQQQQKEQKLLVLGPPNVGHIFKVDSHSPKSNSREPHVQKIATIKCNEHLLLDGTWPSLAFGNRHIRFSLRAGTSKLEIQNQEFPMRSKLNAHQHHSEPAINI